MVDDLFRFHTENLRAVGEVLNRTLALTRDAIRSQDHNGERDLTLSAALLLGMKLENRLGQIIWERGGFAPEERSEVLGARNQHARWSLVIDIGFRRRYNVWYLDDASIGSLAATRRNRMQSAFSEQLRPVIEMRNTLAHGQWIHPLNNKGTNKNREMASSIASESGLTLSIKDRLAHHYCQLVGDLVSTSLAFERDFDVTYEKFEATLSELESADSSAYRAGLLSRHQRGLALRADAGFRGPSAELE